MLMRFVTHWEFEMNLSPLRVNADAACCACLPPHTLLVVPYLFSMWCCHAIYADHAIGREMITHDRNTHCIARNAMTTCPVCNVLSGREATTEPRVTDSRTG